ncbi:MAG: ankyrin repeat domain-containing protein [Gammaproteobacteria bacterium]|nr:ankyrin repeat domain-containing protein [Gammaproteobacteria bacterium]
MDPAILRALILFLGLFAATTSHIGAETSSPLIQAIRAGDLTQVNTLLDNGASAETVTQSGEFAGKTALMWAAEAGEKEIIHALLASGAVVDRPNRKDGTALMYAAVEGEHEALQLLLDAGADPNLQVRHGWSPLLLATVKGHLNVLDALIEAGADPMARDVYGWTLLMRAVDGQKKSMTKRLLDAGIPVDAEDFSGNTALTIAAKLDDPWFIEQLRAYQQPIMLSE